MKENNDFLNQTGSGEIEELKKHKEKVKKDKIEKHVAHVVIVDTITTELAKANITEQALAQLAEYKNLKVIDVNDKENYKLVKEAQTICRNTRLLADDICEKGRAESISIQKRWIAEQKRVTEQIKDVEKYLKEQRDIIDLEKERINKQREVEQEVRMKARITKLLSFGCIFDGETYSLKEGEEVLSLSNLDLKLSDDSAFNIFQVRAEILHQKSIIRIESEQAAAKEEADRVLRIAKENKKKQEDLDKQSADIKRQQDELAAAQAKIKAEEEKAIAVAKAKEDAAIQAKIDQEAALKAAELDKQNAIAELEKQKQEEIALLKKQEEDRIAADLKKKADEEAAIKAEKERVEREANLKPEREKLVAFVHSISHISFPELTSVEGQAVLLKTKEATQKLIAYIITQSNLLK